MRALGCSLVVCCERPHAHYHLNFFIVQKVAQDYKPDIVILPEIWNSPYQNDAFPKYAEDIDGGKSESVNMLR